MSVKSDRVMSVDLVTSILIGAKKIRVPHSKPIADQLDQKPIVSLEVCGSLRVNASAVTHL